jgi:hypothetical protein
MLPKKGKDNVKAEIAANVGISVIFDGSTRLGEALASYILFQVHPRCVKLQLAQSLSQANA